MRGPHLAVHNSEVLRSSNEAVTGGGRLHLFLHLYWMGYRLRELQLAGPSFCYALLAASARGSVATEAMYALR